MFDPAYPVAALRGAEYNPRVISPAALVALERSLRTIGVAKPIIINGDLIVAGHQRTQALRRMGVTHAPVCALPAGLNQSDEIRFNQLHNGVDFDLGDEAAAAGASATLGFEDVPADRLSGNGQAQGANVRAEICSLLNRYGNWGACVALQSGPVIHGAQYALACMILGIAARVFRVADSAGAEAAELLNGRYGQFNYEHLPRASWVQSFAQPFRLREAAEVANRSALYEGYVLPALRPGERVLDFGCGQGDYVKLLKRQGVDIIGVEFFARQGNSIAGGLVNGMIDQLCEALRVGGPFDVVVADSVLNSVDTLQAEGDVLNCLHAFTRRGGRVYFSGRSRARFENRNKTRTHSVRNGEKAVIFLDDDGFSGVFHHGNWFYQKFCTPQQVDALVRPHFAGSSAMVKCDTDRWRVMVTKDAEIAEETAVQSLAREFDLPWPKGRRVGRSNDILAAYAASLALEGG